VIVTAFDGETGKKMALEAGIDDFV